MGTESETRLRPGGGFTEFARGEIEQSIPSRWTAQVRRAPEAIAVSCGGVSLRYRELDALSDRFARAVLRAAGASPQPVAICMDQGPLLPAAILGVLKAGHFYAPFDSSAPAERMARMLEHTGARVAIRDRAGESLTATPGVSWLCADTLAESKPDGDPVATAGLAPGPDSLAYVYYTSGSTGEPKGVFDCHRNVLHNIYRYTNGLAIGSEDRLTLLQTAGFSGAVSSLFCALLNGAACYPAAPRRESPASLAHWVNANRLTMWHSVPALFRRLCASGETFPSVRVVRLEGDRSAPSDIALFREHLSGDCVLVNGLGATETGLSRRYFISQSMPVSESPVPESIVPIGYAVEDMEVVLLDAEEGVGEIGVKSRYLALGYWKRPDLTARAFSDCGDGRRLYRTGDLGRFRADGCLEHLGRKDNAVKIAGNRVDTGEVEAALCAQPGIEHAVVAARTDSRGDARLCAWLVTEPSVRIDAGAMRRTLATTLPPHAVPVSFVAINEIPLNANGKVDRRALPDPPPGRPPLSTPFAEPNTGAEREVARVWRGVFDFEPGAGDDFFDLGGSSLDVARVAAELEVDIEEFLAGPTIRQLAARRNGVRPDPQALVTIREGEGGEALFCAPPHSGLLVGYRNLANHLTPGLALHGFAPPRSGDRPEPYSVADLAERYLAAMRTVQPRGPYLLTGFCFGGLVAFEMACRLEEQGEEVRALALVECYYEGWYRSQPAWRRAAAAVRHGAARVAQHLLLGPRHWSAMAQRVGELRAERRDRTELERLSAEGMPIPERLQSPMFGAGHAAQTFAPKPYSGRVLLFGGVAVRAGEYPAPRMGWDDLLRGPVEEFTLDDGLRGLLSEPRVAEVAGLLEGALRRGGRA